jgi:hypothetical protein
LPCLTYGLLGVLSSGSARNAAEQEYNKQVLADIRAKQSQSVYCPPWQDEDERLQLQAEVSAGLEAYRTGQRHQSLRNDIALPNTLEDKPRDPREFLPSLAPLAHRRLEHHNGPQLVMYTDGTAPVRAVVALFSMILNGYAPPEVLLFGEHQWDQRARDLFAAAAPFAQIISSDQFMEHARACGGPELVEMAQRYPFVARALVPLTYMKEGCFMDDDVLIVDGVDDAQHAFRHSDLVYVPGVDQGNAFRSAWRNVWSVPRPLDTGTFNNGLYWLRRFVDPRIVAEHIRESDPAITPPRIWEQGLIATLYGSRITERLSTARYLSPVNAPALLPPSHNDLVTLLLEYDYSENPQGIAGIHFDRFAGSLSDDDALHLAPTILGRSAVVHHPSELERVSRGQNSR